MSGWHAPADSTMLLSWCAPMNFWTSNTSRHKRRTAASQRRGPVQTERPLPTAALKLHSIPRTCPPPSTVQVAVTTALHCGGSMMQVLSLRLACAVEHFGATIDHASTFCVIRRAFPRCRARVTPPCGSGLGAPASPTGAQCSSHVLWQRCQRPTPSNTACSSNARNTTASCTASRLSKIAGGMVGVALLCCSTCHLPSAFPAPTTAIYASSHDAAVGRCLSSALTSSTCRAAVCRTRLSWGRG